MSSATCGIPPAESAPDIASLIRATRLRSSSYGGASKHASSPPFFVRPGAAGLLLPPVSRKGVRNAWAFHRTRGPVCKGAEKDAHELPSDADPRLRSARDRLFGLAASRLWWARSAGTVFCEATMRSRPRGDALGSDRLHCVRRPHPPRDRTTPALGPGLSSASNHRIPPHKPWRSKLTLSPDRDV